MLNRGAKAVLLCAHQLQEGATRASSLELSALRVGLTDFASAISAALPGRPWRTVWSKSQPVHANRVVLNQAAPALSFASTRSARIGVVGCSDARLWRVTPYEKATLLWDRSDTAGEVRAVGVVETADGRVIAALATSDQRVAAVDCDTGKELWSDDTAHEAPLSALAVSDDPRHPLVASSGVDGIVHVAVLADGTDIVDRARRYRHEADGRGIEIRSLAFIRAQRGWRLLFGAVDGSIGVLDPLTGALLRRWTISDGVVNSVSAHVEPDGRLLILAGASDGSVVLVEPGPADALHEDAKMHVLLTHRSSVNGVSLAQRGEQLVALAASSDRTWSMTSLDEANDGVAVEGHFGVVSSLGWLACDGVELIATVGGDGCCRVWVPEAVRRESLSLEKPTRHSGPVSAIALACRGGDELEVWTGGADGELRYWSSSVAASGRPIAREPVPISALAYHDQGAGPQQIYYGTVRGELFRVETVGGQVSARTLLGIAHDGIEALALATCAGETVLISGGRDGAATVWSTALEEPLVTSQVVRFGGVTALCVLERRAEIPLLAAAGQDGVLSFRRLEALDQLWQVRFDAPVTAVTPLPYHAAGMVVGLANGEIHFVRDVRRTSAAWQILGRHENDVTGVVAFVVGGRLVVASCGVDRSLRIWDLSTRLVLQCIELDGLALSLSSATPHIAVATTAGASVFSLNEDPILLASRPQ